VVCNPALRHGNNRASNDCHDEQTRSVSGEWTELGYAERENAWKHDGVEEAYKDDAPHRDRASSQH